MKLKDAKKVKYLIHSNLDALSHSAILFLLTKSFCLKKVKKRVIQRLLLKIMHALNVMPTPPPLAERII